MTKKAKAEMVVAAILKGFDVDARSLRDELDRVTGKMCWPTLQPGAEVDISHGPGKIVGYAWDYPSLGDWMYIVQIEGGRTCNCWPQDFQAAVVETGGEG